MLQRVAILYMERAATAKYRYSVYLKILIMLIFFFYGHKAIGLVRLEKTEITVKVHSLAIHNGTILWIGIFEGCLGEYPIVFSIEKHLFGFQLFTVMAFYDHITAQIYQIGL